VACCDPTCHVCELLSHAFAYPAVPVLFICSDTWHEFDCSIPLFSVRGISRIKAMFRKASYHWLLIVSKVYFIGLHMQICIVLLKMLLKKRIFCILHSIYLVIHSEQPK